MDGTRADHVNRISAARTAAVSIQDSRLREQPCDGVIIGGGDDLLITIELDDVHGGSSSGDSSIRLVLQIYCNVKNDIANEVSQRLRLKLSAATELSRQLGAPSACLQPRYSLTSNSLPMNPSLEQLITLQAIDLELKRLRDQLVEAPRRVAAADAAKKQAASALAATQASLTKEEALRRAHESSIADHRNKIARLTRQLDIATSTQQVSAYEHEITFGESSISKLEDEELASMERAENLDVELALRKMALEAAEAALERARANSATLTERNTPAIASLDAERKVLRSQLEASDEGAAPLATYDRVAKSKGSGISEAVDHKCSACQMLVRPQRWNDLTGREHANDLYTCETCGRLLFWDPRRDTPGAWAPGERLAQAKAATASAS